MRKHEISEQEDQETQQKVKLNRCFLEIITNTGSGKTEKRVSSIACAIPLTTDKTVIEAHALMATALASQIKLVGALIRTYDERIEYLFDTLPDAELFKSLPGMGPCMGPRMLAALGDNRDRFNSAEEIQRYDEAKYLLALEARQSPLLKP